MKRQMLSTILLSGYLFFGQYFDSTYLDLEGRPVKYRAGTHLEFETKKNWPTLFLENETFMQGGSEGGFYPSQVNYELGLKQTFGTTEFILTHKCLHPVDGRSNGLAAQDYGLIEVRYGF